MDDREAIYELLVADIYKFLLYFTGSHEEAEDLTQDTFVKVFAKWETYRDLASVKTWLLSIARNLAVDRFRKNNRAVKLYFSLRHQPVYTTDLPEELVDAEESKRELYAAIQSLKPDYRAVTILRGVQDNTPQETAKILGWTENKVNVTFHRALKQLQKTMVQEGRRN